jgi:phenylpropionate dioxygenase-like ring-hydroxylating dioxygenase large terminal subunit
MALANRLQSDTGLMAAEAYETLPAWIYNNAEFYRLEREHVFKRHWQFAGHVCEVPKPGDYLTLSVMGLRLLVLRGEDGALRAFHNVCRHRAAKLLSGGEGHCERFIECRYHGWTYHLDGRLRTVPAEGSFEGLDREQFGLKAIELEQFLGLVFVRVERGGPSVAEIFAPYRAELEDYRIPEMICIGERFFADRGVDWKIVIDNYLEGYHVPVAHPGLFRLFGKKYEVEVRPHGLARALQWLQDKPSSVWSERAYQALLPDVAHLPPERRRAWAYYSLFPNVAFDLFPETLGHFHVIPTAPGCSVLRYRTYGHADKGRALHAVRWLSRRINGQIDAEDVDVTKRVQAGLESGGYETGLLSKHEICVKRFHDAIRRAIPVARLRRAPAPGTVVERNRELASGLMS